MFSPLYKAVGTVVLIVSAFAPADAFVSSPASLSLKGKNAASISTRSIVVTPKSSLRDCNLLSGVRSLSAQAEAGTQEEPLTVAMIGATGGVGRLTAAIVREQPSDPHHPRTEFLFVQFKFCAKLAERTPTRLVWREGEGSCQGSFKRQEAPGRCEHSISLFQSGLDNHEGSTGHLLLHRSSYEDLSAHIYLFIHPYIYMSIYQSPSLSLSLSLPPPLFLPSPRKYSPLLSPIFPNIHACATAHREKRCWAG
jgi:hypothetical protein